MEGYMLKKKNSKVTKGFHKRWFRLDNFRLSYYASKDKASDARKMQGTIDLRQTHSLVDDTRIGHETSFILHAAIGEWEFKCPSIQEKRLWLHMLSVFHGIMPLPSDNTTGVNIPQEPVVEGLISKKKSSRMLGGWHKRYCRLNRNHTLVYFDAKDSKKQTGSIDLRVVHEVKDDVIDTDFTLHTESAAWIFRTESFADRTLWAESIRSAMRHIAAQRATMLGALSMTTIPIPRVMFDGMMACIRFMAIGGTETDGIFRQSASTSQVEKLYQSFLKGTKADRMTTSSTEIVHGKKESLPPTRSSSPDARPYVSEVKIPENTSIHVVSATFKKLLRELPETLLTNRLFEHFVFPPGDKPLTQEELSSLVHQLPGPNQTVLAALARLIGDISDNASVTKMNAKALSTYIGPAFVRKDQPPSLVDMSRLFVSLSTYKDDSDRNAPSVRFTTETSLPTRGEDKTNSSDTHTNHDDDEDDDTSDEEEIHDRDRVDDPSLVPPSGSRMTTSGTGSTSGSGTNTARGSTLSNISSSSLDERSSSVGSQNTSPNHTTAIAASSFSSTPSTAVPSSSSSSSNANNANNATSLPSPLPSPSIPSSDQIDLQGQVQRQSEMIRALQSSLTTRNDEYNTLQSQLTSLRDDHRQLQTRYDQYVTEQRITDMTHAKLVDDLHAQIAHLKSLIPATSSVAPSSSSPAVAIAATNQSSGSNNNDSNHDAVPSGAVPSSTDQLRDRIMAAHRTLTERVNADLERRAVLEYEHVPSSPIPPSSSSHALPPRGAPPSSSSSAPLLSLSSSPSSASSITSSSHHTVSSSVKRGSNDLPRELRLFRQHFVGKRPLHFKYGDTPMAKHT